MEPSIYTWNSLAINDSNPFVAVIPPGQMANLSTNSIMTDRAGDFPYMSGIVQTPHILVIEVYVAAGQNIATSRETLKKYFNIADETRHNLIVKDTADGNKQYYVTAYPVGIAPLGSAPKNGFAIRLQVEYPYWQLVTAVTDSWSITASGQTKAVTNGGNIKVPPVFTFTPTTTKSGGLSYRRYVPIYNNLDTSFVFPLDITDGGIDTATLTTAKMQADGDDFRVWLDGSFADRWLDSMDTANTKCWLNYSLAPRHEGTLSTTINNSVTTLVFSQTKANLQFLQWLKRAANNTILIESEAITYTAANVDTAGYQITSVSRGAKTTTAASHTAPITVRHIEHDLWILYGDSSLTAQDVDDDYKPMIDLSSTNAALSWTNYYDNGSNRSAMWTGGVSASKTGLSYVYTDDENTFANPSVVMGMALVNYSDNRVQFETGVTEWTFTHPAGMTAATYSGKKYNTSSWPGIAGLQYLQDNVAWFTASNIAAPSVASTWEAFGSISVSFGATYNSIRFAMDGSLAPNSNEAALIQFDPATVTVDSTKLPTIALAAEAVINFFDIKLTNNTTGEYLQVTCPCPVNATLTIDCDAREAYLSDGTRVNVRLSTNRETWLDAAAGSNTYQYDDTGTVAVTGAIVHRDRIL